MIKFGPAEGERRRETTESVDLRRLLANRNSFPFDTEPNIVYKTQRGLSIGRSEARMLPAGSGVSLRLSPR